MRILYKSLIQMGNKVVKERLENVSKTGTLTLCGLKLKELPEELWSSSAGSALRSLDVSNNKLTLIPGRISAFKNNLKQLKVDSNRIAQLPDEMGILFKLEVFSASSNRLQFLPDSFGCLQCLKSVNLSSNDLRTFPSALCQLQCLEVLDLSSNRISTLPDQIGDVAAVEINLNQNQLEQLTDEIVRAKKLKILRLQENNLDLSQFSEKILAQSKLTVLAVEGNLFNLNDFRALPGFEAFAQRSTEVKRKLDS